MRRFAHMGNHICTQKCTHMQTPMQHTHMHAHHTHMHIQKHTRATHTCKHTHMSAAQVWFRCRIVKDLPHASCQVHGGSQKWHMQNSPVPIHLAVSTSCVRPGSVTGQQVSEANLKFPPRVRLTNIGATHATNGILTKICPMTHMTWMVTWKMAWAMRQRQSTTMRSNHHHPAALSVLERLYLKRMCMCKA